MPPSKSKKRAPSDDERPQKRSCCVQLKSEEPDVLVVVGGQEFYEYRQILCASIGYFDCAFRSGMKEAQTKRFEFPHKDPKEWELLVSVLSPAYVRAKEEDISTILEWCEELCIHRLPACCDDAFYEWVRSELPLPTLDSFEEGDDLSTDEITAIEQHGSQLWELLEKSTKFQLEFTTEYLFTMSKRLLLKGPGMFSQEAVKKWILLLLGNERCAKEFTPTVVYFLRDDEDFAGKTIDELLGIDFLPNFIRAKMQLEEHRVKQERLEKNMDSPTLTCYFGPGYFCRSSP